MGECTCVGFCDKFFSSANTCFSYTIRNLFYSVAFWNGQFVLRADFTGLQKRHNLCRCHTCIHIIGTHLIRSVVSVDFTAQTECKGVGDQSLFLQNICNIGCCRAGRDGDGNCFTGQVFCTAIHHHDPFHKLERENADHQRNNKYNKPFETF